MTTPRSFFCVFFVTKNDTNDISKQVVLLLYSLGCASTLGGSEEYCSSRPSCCYRCCCYRCRVCLWTPFFFSSFFFFSICVVLFFFFFFFLTVCSCDVMTRERRRFFFFFLVFFSKKDKKKHTKNTQKNHITVHRAQKKKVSLSRQNASFARGEDLEEEEEGRRCGSAAKTTYSRG